MKKLSVLFAAVMMFMSFGVAKAQKIATVDVAAILNMMPEKIKADEQLKAFSTAKQAELEKLATAFQADVQKYQQEGAKLTAQQREAKEAELGKTQQNLQQMSQTAQKDLLDRQDAAYAPIEKRLNDAITRAAKANGWDFVFDSATNGLIYKAGPDATAAIKKELGL